MDELGRANVRRSLRCAQRTEQVYETLRRTQTEHGGEEVVECMDTTRLTMMMMMM